MTYVDYIEQAKMTTYPEIKSGMMVSGKMAAGITIFCPMTKFKVCVDEYRSIMANKDLAVKLYKQYLVETNCIITNPNSTRELNKKEKSKGKSALEILKEYGLKK